jgi:hypothetical protein
VEVDTVQEFERLSAGRGYVDVEVWMHKSPLYGNVIVTWFICAFQRTSRVFAV